MLPVAPARARIQLEKPELTLGRGRTCRSSCRWTACGLHCRITWRPAASLRDAAQEGPGGRARLAKARAFARERRRITPATQAQVHGVGDTEAPTMKRYTASSRNALTQVKNRRSDGCARARVARERRGNAGLRAAGGHRRVQGDQRRGGPVFGDTCWRRSRS